MRTMPQPPPVERTQFVRADDSDLVPRVLRVAAALGWRLLVVVAALYVVGIVVSYLAAVVVPVAVALLLAALLSPAVHRLQVHGVPRGVATALVMVGGLAALGGVLTFVVATFVRGRARTGRPALHQRRTDRGLADHRPAAAQCRATLRRAGPGARHAQRQPVGDHLGRAHHRGNHRRDRHRDAAGAVRPHLLPARRPRDLAVPPRRSFPRGAHRVDVAGRRGVAALVSYVRATAVVAVVDAVAIGIGLAVLGVPLAVPLAALVFLGAFVPIIGAVIAGGVAVLVALVANGPVAALIVLGIIVAVMQLEGHVLQPLLLGRAVKLHPLAVVLAIAAGLIVAGIAGALFAVPLLAVLNSGIRSLRSPADEHIDPDDVHTSAPEETGPDEPGLDRQPELTPADAAT